MHHPDRDSEYMEIVKHVTNGTTHFFRESYQFDLLIKHVLPVYLEKPREEPVRILSAGCSSGEEAWSLAIALHDAFGSFPGPQWSIDACDINPLRIARARQGEYEEKSLRECDSDIVDRCFDRIGDRYRLKDTYREGVRFFEANLTTGSSYPWKPYDIIFCRNVLIYFSDAAFAKTVERFARRLTGQGHLFLGHSESLIHRSSDFEPVCLEEKIIYRKRQG